MNLFDNEIDFARNVLPRDGIVNYHGPLFQSERANMLLQKLLEEPDWKNDLAVVFGKTIVTKRKVAWYGDQDFAYTYSGVTRTALPWTPVLAYLKAVVEQKTGEAFNSCLLNLYHHGDEGMAWHSDAERELKKNGAIGSLSFGAERRFSFKHKVTKEKIDITLEHGSLLVMKGTTQTNWLHRLPPMKSIKRPRVSLTFRTMNRGGS